MIVSEITAAVEMEQSAVSHQLRHLRDLRFVVTERQGCSVIYRLFDDHVVELITQGLANAEHLQLQDNAGAPSTQGTPTPAWSMDD